MKNLTGSEDGFALVEASLALALLLTVLVPLSTAALGLSVRQKQADQLTALALGREAMEQALFYTQYETDTRWSDDRRWRVERAVRWTGRQVVLIVRVYRGRATEPHITLMTTRPAR